MTDEDCINVDSFEVDEGWSCRTNEHPADDDTSDALDALWDGDGAL